MAQTTVPVTVENFIRAESDLYFTTIAVKEGRFGKIGHNRDVADVDNQTIVRLNRDTLYSSGIFDLDAGPVTIKLPDTSDQFMSVQVISEDQYSLPAIYDTEPHTLTLEQVGTRYVVLGIRTLVDPTDPVDLDAAHALQDAIKVEQPGGPGSFETPAWDPVSQKKSATRSSASLGGLPPQVAAAEIQPLDRIDIAGHPERPAGVGEGAGQDGLSQLHSAQERRHGPSIACMSPTCRSTASGR